MNPGISAEKRAEIIRLRRDEGATKDAIRKAVHASSGAVDRVLFEAGLQTKAPWRPKREKKAAQKPVPRPAALPRSRPSAGEIAAPLNLRNPYAGRGCPTGTCRNLVGCSCGSPREARRLSPEEVATTPVRTDFRIADVNKRGQAKTVNVPGKNRKARAKAARVRPTTPTAEERAVRAVLLPNHQPHDGVSQ